MTCSAKLFTCGVVQIVSAPYGVDRLFPAPELDLRSLNLCSTTESITSKSRFALQGVCVWKYGRPVLETLTALYEIHVNMSPILGNPQ